nr:PREDICTED: uncharacterized protein LOC105663835 isoform X2 [Megachile rotundata]XP_012150916.1 PREDICTED: uncharacterized protein LOC105663835 isoform X3 [Megachile rotundata]
MSSVINMPSQPGGTQRTSTMELRPRQTEQISEDEVAIIQKQQIEKEKRLREETRKLDDERRELEQARRQNEALLAKIRGAEKDQGAIPKKMDIPEELPARMEVPSVAVGGESVSYTLSEAVKMVPAFNGTTPTLLTFTRTRKRAAAVEDEEADTVAELCNLLKDIFGPQRTIDYYRDELANAYMKSGEHILDFITRVKDLRDAILDCDRSIPDVDEINDFVKNCFIDGLMSPLRLEVKQVASQPLKCVFREAISVFKRLELEKSRLGRTETRRVNFERRDQTPEWRERRLSSPPHRDSWRSTSPALSRNYQSDRGFTRYLRRDDRRDPPRSEKFCRFCNIPGHDLHECRRRQYSERMRNSGNERALPPAATKGWEGPSTKTVHAVTLEQPESIASTAVKQQSPKSE